MLMPAAYGMEKTYYFLNISKTAERCRFDAAHELAHLVMHRHGPTFTEESSNENNIEKRPISLPLHFNAERKHISLSSDYARLIFYYKIEKIL